ncbi:hypothetical protein GGS26DRAFT_407922 [Hypomontagnella submonticulosa]|nr:hypothetical protein GGS26DRAFT_407922 [Hypomontagnella submonticulosa]
MYTLNAPTAFLAALLAVGRVKAIIFPPLTGHDFDFTATYKSGLKLSPADPPRDVMAAKEIIFERPTLTLTDPDKAGRDDQYLSFLEISYIPTIDMLDDVIFTFPWIKTHLIVSENGTLSDELYESHSIYRADYIPSSEIRNATLHVWRQTPALMDFIENDPNKMPTFWQLARVWSNSTEKVDKNFARANVDFKVRNETGTFRGDVDENGASIEGYVSTSTKGPKSTPTDGPASTTGSADAPATTTDAANPTGTPNAAAPQLGFSALWTMGASGLLLLGSVMTLI